MSGVLERVEGPESLKGLSLEELRQLAEEIRQELIGTVTLNGGHLASNLGVVELSIALHRVFDSPTDKIIWDVGHQSYVHKLLTGRRSQFATLRQYGGLSGFTEPRESPHDAFGAGHASTSISAALGMVMARDLAGEDHHVVAIIGDGALTGGMAFEALNQVGHLGGRFIVILNDNAMSISPNVGALSRSLNRVRLAPSYYRTKKGAERIVTRLPLGERLWRMARRVKESVKGMFIPTMIWEELGFTYVGPIDGHDLSALEMALHRAKRYSARPTFIHVLTHKGKGYPPAEVDAVGFHGLAPNGRSGNGAPSYTKVFSQTVARLLLEDPKVVVITAAMLEGTGLAPVARQFPERVFDVGICEQHAVTFAAGLAAQGCRPIVAIYSTFLQRAYDQVLHDVCIQGLPVVFALDRGGIVGEDGKTHQGLFDLSYLRHIPEMVVAAPKDENELQHLLFTALRSGRPMAVRYPRGSGPGVPLDGEFRELPLGQAEVLREGRDLLLLPIGSTVYPALEAAKRLADDGIEAMVANARFAKPLDEALICQVAQQLKRVVTVEENVLAGGFGSAVLELLAQAGRDGVRVERIGLPDEFVAQGPQALLRAQYGLDAAGIVRRVRAAFPELGERVRPLAHRGG